MRQNVLTKRGNSANRERRYRQQARQDRAQGVRGASACRLIEGAPTKIRRAIARPSAGRGASCSLQRRPFIWRHAGAHSEGLHLSHAAEMERMRSDVCHVIQYGSATIHTRNEPAMEWIAWDKELELGQRAMDDDHKGLIALVNALADKIVFFRAMAHAAYRHIGQGACGFSRCQSALIPASFTTFCHF